jgi:hypothetical protein
MPTRLTSFPVSREGEVKDWEAGSRPKCLIRTACEGVKAKGSTFLYTISASVFPPSGASFVTGAAPPPMGGEGR